MAVIIDLSEARLKRDGEPDPQFVTYDLDGRVMYAFAIEFNHDGGTWAVNIFAYDWDDADRRVQSMRQSLTVRGQLYGEVPA